MIDDNIVIGIVTETDVLRLFLQGKNLHATLASEFMTQNIITAEPDSLVLSAIKGFLDNQIHHLPIIHEDKLVGIVNRHDLIKNIVDSASDFSLIS